MPDDKKHETSTFAVSSRSEGATSFLGLPAAIQEMSAWSPEHWNAPEHFGEFPILSICPEAPGFFADAAHFTNRDLKTIAAILGETFDPNHPETLYCALLTKIEADPWLFPILETIVEQRRGSKKGQRGRNPTLKRGVISKLPLSKLRLDAHPELHDRAHELLLDSVDPAIAVGAFCEYAIMHYYHRMSDPENMEELYDEALKILTYSGPTEEVEARLPLVDEGTNWFEFGTTVAQLLADEPKAASPSILAALHIALKGLAGEIVVGSVVEVDRVSLLKDLAELAGEVHQTLTELAADITGERLRALGVVSDDYKLDGDVNAVASALLTDDFYELLLGRKNKIEETKISLDGISEEIAGATAKKDYATIGRLATDAEELERSLSRMDEAFEKTLDLFRSLLDETPDRFAQLLEDFDLERDADVFNEDYDTSEYQSIFNELSVDSRETKDVESNHNVVVAQQLEEFSEESTEVATADLTSFEDEFGETEVHTQNQVEDVKHDGGAKKPDGYEVAGPIEECLDKVPAPSEDIGAKVEGEHREDARQESREQQLVDFDPPTPSIEEQSDVTSAQESEKTSSMVDRATFASLIERGLIGIAADAAEAFEERGEALPLPSSTLRVAAASRAPHRGFGPDLQKFKELVGIATSNHLSDLASVAVLGSILRPAILSKDTALRAQVSNLCKGILGQHLVEINDTVSKLSFEFPPRPDKLAELSGSPGTPQSQRVAERLKQSCEAFRRKKSRWPFATEFMHYLVSNNGAVGAAVSAILQKRSDALERARYAVEKLGNASALEALSEEYAADKGYNDLALYSKGVEYLVRQFDEPVALLESWILATQADEIDSKQSEERLQRTAATLRSQLEKASEGLEKEAKNAHDALIAAVAVWIKEQLQAANEALLGRDTGTFSTLEDAIAAERDLLPPADRAALEDTEDRAAIYERILNNDLILDEHQAITRACYEGAFEAAFRMVGQFDVSSDADVKTAIVHFVEKWRPELERRSRHLTALDKVDFKNQDEISRQLTWCKITRSKLDGLADGTEIHDLAGLAERLSSMDQIVSGIEVSIREGQITRIKEYRKAENEEDVEHLLSALDDLTIEAIEDRIAQLRDGRSAAVFETDLVGLIGEFTKNFLSFGCSSDWPTNTTAFENAFSKEDSPLFTDIDRRSAAAAFIEMFRNLMTQMRTDRPNLNQLRELFEEIGFENVSVSNLSQFGRSGSWSGRVVAHIQSDGWFLPPTFGSNANNGYNLILASPDTLPETMIKALGESDEPSIILLSGVADASRRHEIAERLRAKALPALLVDEALVAFAATRRDTRARTIFECGLPYGRIEPYTTDAGQLPPEMFFGREDEIRKIIAKTADGCLVYGGRQLGKSALLAHIAQTQHDPEAKRFIVNREVKPLGNSEKTSEIWRHISSMLPDSIVKPDNTSAEEVAKDVQAWVGRNPNGRIICMFDEADNFMAQDTRDDYPQLSKLKELMEKTQRAFKVVFAGLHNVQRMHKQPNSPLWHLGEPICIGPLNRNIDDKRAAFDLVVSPMRAAGFGFESVQAVEEVLTWANYYPSLVQEYMKGLLATMNGAGSGKAYKLPADGPLWKIPSDTLFAHRGFNQIESRIRDKFHLTLNLDPRYALVAYTLARLIYEGDERRALITGLSPRNLMDEAQIYWPKTSEAPTLPGFEALLEELFDLGVLGRNPLPGSDNRFNYLLRTREVAAMLGSENDIYHALDEIENKDPTVAYDRATHRRRYPATHRQPQAEWPYAPLSDLQLERIASNDNRPVQIICGLEVLGLGKVISSLKRIAEIGNFPGAGEEKIFVEAASSREDLRRIIDKARPQAGKRMILAYEVSDPSEAKTVLDWLNGQEMVINNTVRPLVILSASHPELRALAIRREDQAQFLSPWGAEMIRVHLDDIERTNLDTPELRTLILNATGGIPSEVTALIATMHLAESPETEAESWSPKAKLPQDFLNDVVAEALWILNEEGDFKTKNELLIEVAGTDIDTIGPDLQATGLVTRGRKKNSQYQLTALGRYLARSVRV